MVATVKFTLERTTKNTVRYQEQVEGDESVIGVLYVHKSALPSVAGAFPETLVVTLEA